MKNTILLILGVFLFYSCEKSNDENTMDHLGDICNSETKISPPSGFEVNPIGGINCTRAVHSFQFLDEKNGYVMTGLGGGNVGLFKSINGGKSWSALPIGINRHPVSMIFKDVNFGMITVHDITGCPPPNCQNRCFVLITKNGGLNWKEVEYKELKGVLYHPKYDSNGNLYASLSLEEQTTLMKSTDDGESWEVFYSSPELGFSLVTYSFEIFQDKIYMSGRNGEIFIIDSYGQLIHTLETGSLFIWDVEIIDENNLIVVVSGRVIKTKDGGNTWEEIYEESARMIGFESPDKGLMMLFKSAVPTDVYEVEDVIASTVDGGLLWNEADKTTTNMRSYFKNRQRMGEGWWYLMIGNKLFEIKEN